MPTREQVNYFGAGPAPLPTKVLERAATALLNYKDTGIGLCEISHRSAHANAILEDAKSAMTALYDIPDSHQILFLQGGGSAQFSAVVYNLVSIWVEKQRRRIEQDVKDGMANDQDAMTDEEIATKVLRRLEEEVNNELKLDYIITGSWSLKASQEAARLVGADKVKVVVDARTSNAGKFGTIPDESCWQMSQGKTQSSAGPALIYYCDNETVDGVEFPGFPKSLEVLAGNTGNDNCPLVVADMSSNFISRRVDVKKYAVIFGGAQKNIGNTGITLVIIHRSLLPPVASTASPHVLRALGLSVGPIILDWATVAKNNSLYNTLPILEVWIAGQVMLDLVEKHGARKIAGQEDDSNRKAERIYSVLDKQAHVYHVVPDKSARSRMNICFRVHGGNAEKEKEFLAGAEERGLTGLKGHRSVGGIRASNCE